MNKAKFVLVVALVVLALVAVVPAAAAAPDIEGKSIEREDSESNSSKIFWSPNPFFCPVNYCPDDAFFCSCWFYIPTLDQ